MGRKEYLLTKISIGFTWRPEPTPTEQAIGAMKAALESGLSLWNGAEFYGTAECNSMTLLKAYFTRYPLDADRVTLVVKGGMDLDTHRPNGSPEGTRRSLDNIIRGLGGLKKLDGFAPSRRDPDTPLEVTFGIIQREYIDTGKVGAIYLSECSADTIREAAKCARIGAAEVELSMFSPDILSNGIGKACADNNIPILAYSPMGRGVSPPHCYSRYLANEAAANASLISDSHRTLQEHFRHQRSRHHDGAAPFSAWCI